MKKILTALLISLSCAAVAQANMLQWQDNSNNETGFSVEMLNGGTWAEVAKVGANITTYVDAFTEGVYRVRAFLNLSDGTVLFSAYTNSAALLNAPSNATVLR